MGERFLRKKPKKLRIPRVANAAKLDNLGRSFCEVSPEKLRFPRVANAYKLDKNCEITATMELRKSKKYTALELSQMTKKS